MRMITNCLFDLTFLEFVFDQYLVLNCVITLIKPQKILPLWHFEDKCHYCPVWPMSFPYIREVSNSCS